MRLALVLALVGCAARPSTAPSPASPTAPLDCRVDTPGACPTRTICLNVRQGHSECRPIPMEAPVAGMILPVDAESELFLTHCPGEGSHAWDNAAFALDLDSAYDAPPATIRASAEGVAYVFPQGTTCTTPAGTPARSQEDACGEGWGNHVKVFHEGGYFTLYAHLERVMVRDGQRVTQGEALGIEGMTGMAGHRHLHWSVQRLPGGNAEAWAAQRGWVGQSVPFRFEAMRDGQRVSVNVATLRCPHSTAGALPANVQPRYRGLPAEPNEQGPAAP